VEHIQMHVVLKKGIIHFHYTAIFVEFLVILLFHETKNSNNGYKGLGFL
jgi:hypothetical protein